MSAADVANLESSSRFAEWLEAGERFAAELGPVEVESALVDTLTAWLYRRRPVGQPEVTR